MTVCRKGKLAMREYRPSNRVPLPGLLLMITAAVVGGLGAGVITYFVSRELYLVVVFPILLGLLCGWIAALVVQIGRVRAPLAAGAFGVLMALILYGTYRYADYYWGFRGDLKKHFEDAIDQKITDDQYQAFEDMALQEAVDATGFVGYTKLTAREGITITKATRLTGGGLTLKGGVLYVYWMIEIGLISYFAAAGAYRSARKPFSEQTGDWYGPAQRVGTLPAESISAFVALMQQGQLAQAGALTVPEGGDPPRTDVAIYRSAAPDDELVLVMQRLVNRRSSVGAKDLTRWIVTPAEWAIFQGGLSSSSSDAESV
jgi:hypothetical protein